MLFRIGEKMLQSVVKYCLVDLRHTEEAKAGQKLLMTYIE